MTTTTTTTTAPSALERLLLIDPAAIDRTLDVLGTCLANLDDDTRRLCGACALPERLPTRAQLSRTVTRMWRRLLVTRDPIGLSSNPPRGTWRARALQWRLLRFPFLLAEGSVVPGDLSGLRSTPDVIIKHLLGTHHDAISGVAQARYDLELLALHPGALVRLRADTAAVIDGTHPKAALYRDLCVYEGYHESLLALVDDVIENGFPACDNPDLSFFAMLRWCAHQPDVPLTPAAVWQELASPGTTTVPA